MRDELRSYGLSAHTQSYAFSLPPNGSKHPHRSANSRDPLSAETLSGANAYARSPSARIDGREAVVISATWKSRWPGEADQLNEQAEGEGEGEGLERGEMKDNVRGVALLLSLANYLTSECAVSKKELQRSRASAYTCVLSRAALAPHGSRSLFCSLHVQNTRTGAKISSLS